MPTFFEGTSAKINMCYGAFYQINYQEAIKINPAE